MKNLRAFILGALVACAAPLGAVLGSMILGGCSNIPFVDTKPNKAGVSDSAVTARTTGEIYALALQAGALVVKDPKTNPKVRSWLVVSEPVATELVRIALVANGATPPVLSADAADPPGSATQAQTAAAGGVTAETFLSLFMTYLPTAETLTLQETQISQDGVAFRSGAKPFDARTELTATELRLESAVGGFRATVASLGR